MLILVLLENNENILRPYGGSTALRAGSKLGTRYFLENTSVDLLYSKLELYNYYTFLYHY